MRPAGQGARTGALHGGTLLAVKVDARGRGGAQSAGEGAADLIAPRFASRSLPRPARL